MAFTAETHIFRSLPGLDGRSRQRTVETPERKMVVVGGKLRERHTYADGEQQIVVVTDRGGSTKLTRSPHGGLVIEGKGIHQLSIGESQAGQEGPRILIKAAITEVVAGSGAFWFDGEGGSVGRMRATGPVEIHTPLNHHTGTIADHRRFIAVIEEGQNGVVAVNPAHQRSSRTEPVVSARDAEVVPLRTESDIRTTEEPIVTEPIHGLLMSQRPENNQPLPQVRREGNDESGREKLVMQGNLLSELIIGSKKAVDAQEVHLISNVQIAETSTLILDSVASAFVEGELRVIGIVGTLEVGKTGLADIDTLLGRADVSGSLIADQIDGLLKAGGTKEQPATITTEHMSKKGLAVFRDHVHAVMSEGRIAVVGEEDVLLNGEHVVPGLYHVTREKGVIRIGDIPFPDAVAVPAGSEQQMPTSNNFVKGNHTREVELMSPIVEFVPEGYYGQKRVYSHPTNAELSLWVPDGSQLPGVVLTPEGFRLTRLANGEKDGLNSGVFRTNGVLEIPGAKYVASYGGGEVDATIGYVGTGVAFPGSSLEVVKAGNIRIGGNIDGKHPSKLKIEKAKDGSKTQIDKVAVYGHANIVLAEGLDPREVIKKLVVKGSGNTITANGETIILKYGWGSGLQPYREQTIEGSNPPRERAFYSCNPLKVEPAFSVVIPEFGDLPEVMPHASEVNNFLVRGKLFRLDVPGITVDATLSDIEIVNAYAGGNIKAGRVHEGMVQGASKLTADYAEILNVRGLSKPVVGTGTAEATVKEVKVLKLSGNTIVDVASFADDAVVIVEGRSNRLRGKVNGRLRTNGIYAVEGGRLVEIKDPTRLTEIKEKYLSKPNVTSLRNADTTPTVLDREVFADMTGDAPREEVPQENALENDGRTDAAEVSAVQTLDELVKMGVPGAAALLKESPNLTPENFKAALRLLQQLATEAPDLRDTFPKRELVDIGMVAQLATRAPLSEEVHAKAVVSTQKAFGVFDESDLHPDDSGAAYMMRDPHTGEAMHRIIRRKPLLPPFQQWTREDLQPRNR